MFFLQQGHVVMDFDLDLLVEMLTIVDRQVEVVESQIRQSSDPDGFGICDTMEGVVGLGFVACQQYLNATWGQLAKPGKKRWEVLALPPKHACGPLVCRDHGCRRQLLETSRRMAYSEGKKKILEDRTRDVISSLFSPAGDYPLGNVLVHLARPRPARFASLVLELTKWRNEQIQWPA